MELFAPPPQIPISSKLINQFVLHPILLFSLWQRIHIWYYCQVDISYSVYSYPQLLLHDHTASSIGRAGTFTVVATTVIGFWITLRHYAHFNESRCLYTILKLKQMQCLVLNMYYTHSTEMSCYLVFLKHVRGFHCKAETHGTDKSFRIGSSSTLPCGLNAG
jgi:hypothetical protein